MRPRIVTIAAALAFALAVPYARAEPRPLEKVGDVYEVDRQALTTALRAEVARARGGDTSDFTVKGDTLVVKPSHPGCAFRTMAIPHGATLREIGGQPVHSPDDFVREMAVALTIARHRLELQLTSKGRPLALTYVFPAVTDSPDAPSAIDLSGIVELAPHHVSVPRSLADALLANVMELSKAARFVPWVKDGAILGYKIFALRPGSFFARLGLENGDLVSSVNGVVLSSPERALEIYTTLRGANELVIVGERRGAPLTLTITIR